MCTVTFITSGEKVFITHNRDEKKLRPRALPPMVAAVNGVRLLFPRDAKAGGSWIALSEMGHAAVLLNGAFEAHLHQPPYRKSRGLAFLDVVAADDLLDAYAGVDLDNIEPFTIILFQRGQLAECRWDGSRKHVLQLDSSQPYTWSSATLYDANVINRRSQWFSNWLKGRSTFSLDEIMQYHLFGGEGDAHNDLRMNRDGITMTVSITGMELQQGKGIMKYFDLLEDTRTTQELAFTKSPATNE